MVLIQIWCFPLVLIVLIIVMIPWISEKTFRTEPHWVSIHTRTSVSPSSTNDTQSPDCLTSVSLLGPGEVGRGVFLVWIGSCTGASSACNANIQYKLNSSSIPAKVNCQGAYSINLHIWVNGTNPWWVSAFKIVPEQIRSQVLLWGHSFKVASHLAVTKILALVKQHFLWSSFPAIAGTLCRPDLSTPMESHHIDLLTSPTPSNSRQTMMLHHCWVTGPPLFEGNTTILTRVDIIKLLVALPKFPSQSETAHRLVQLFFFRSTFRHCFRERSAVYFPCVEIGSCGSDGNAFFQWLDGSWFNRRPCS